jgi:hypothetical protein
MKNKFILIAISSLIIILSVSSVYAQNIEIGVPEKTILLYTGKQKSIEVLVKNTGLSKDTFYFSVWPTYWVDLEKYWMTLIHDEVGNITLNFNPPIDAEEGTMVYTLTARSVDNNVSASKTINFKILRSTSVFLSEIKIDKNKFAPGETLNVKPIITNIHKTNPSRVYVTINILKEDSLVEKFENELLIGPNTADSLTDSLELDKTYLAGEYEIEVVVKNELNKVLDKKTINFEIETVHKIDEEKKTENNILYSTVTIEIINNGNVVESDFYVTESLPLISKNFFYPEIEPENQEEKGNRIVYKWLIQELSPTEKMIIIYQLRFTNLVLVSSLLIIIVVWLIWLFYRPQLRKSYLGFLSGGKEITISLHLKNKKRKKIKDITVHDTVPPLAAVVKKFDTLVPTVKRKDTGTELTWHIKELRPKEERVLTYKIKPTIDVLGKLKLPKAHATYKTGKDKKSRVLSKTVSLMGKVK